jgi:hypothetical protein
LICNPTVTEWVAVALVPVTVITKPEPVCADELTLTVIVDDPPVVTNAGLKLTVTPEGWPLALRITDCAEPATTAVLIVDVPLLPRLMTRLVGLAAMEKSDGAAVTVKLTVAECVALGPVPVTVIVYVPVAVPDPTSIVTADDPPAVTEAGLNETVVPDGWPLALRLTDCAEPAVTAVLIVEPPLCPCSTLTAVGLAAIEKSDDEGVTVKLTVAECVALGPVPVTVIV